jgi:hypothetical protein
MNETEETEMLEALRRDVNALPARLKRVRDLEREVNDREKAAAAAHHGAMVELDGLTAAHEAKCAEREHGLANREAALVERERTVEEKAQRAEATMRMAEMRAADLSNRLHGHAA